MAHFTGFTSSETFTQIPDSFLRLLKEIEDVSELKVALFALWQIERMEGNFRALSESNFEAEALGLTVKEIKRGLKKCVERGILLKAEKEAQVLYFLNSPRGRLAAEAYLKSAEPASLNSVAQEKSNVFKLYEENIGPLTPLIAETLKDAEETYASEWIADALARAVKNNKRNWKYVEAILKRWKEEGRVEKQDRRNAQEDRQQSLNRKIEELRKRSGR